MVTLDGLFESLKTEVEAVFMEAPSVNLEALALQAEAMQRSLDEMVRIAPPRKPAKACFVDDPETHACALRCMLFVKRLECGGMS